MQLVKQTEKYKAAIQLEDGTILEVGEQATGGPNAEVYNIIIVYDDNFGPKCGFEYNPKTRKLSEVKTFG